MNVGDTVSDFTLQNTKGDNVTFSDQIDEKNILLLFFPLAFSSVCTGEMCKIRDDMKLYKSLDTNIIGISVDSFFVLREFKKSNNIQFQLLSDFNKKVSEYFDVLYEDYFGLKGVAKRSAFVINKEMRVEYAEVLEDSAQLPNFKAIHKVLK